jgi:hypothetical protein
MDFPNPYARHPFDENLKEELKDAPLPEPAIIRRQLLPNFQELLRLTFMFPAFITDLVPTVGSFRNWFRRYQIYLMQYRNLHYPTAEIDEILIQIVPWYNNYEVILRNAIEIANARTAQERAIAERRNRTLHDYETHKYFKNEQR